MPLHADPSSLFESTELTEIESPLGSISDNTGIAIPIDRRRLLRMGNRKEMLIFVASETSHATNGVAFQLEECGPYGDDRVSQSRRNCPQRALLRAVIAALQFHDWAKEGRKRLVIATDSHWLCNELKQVQLWKMEDRLSKEEGLDVRWWEVKTKHLEHARKVAKDGKVSKARKDFMAYRGWLCARGST
ncbi:uncharacterized protein LY89DRAFT_670382 [Mollisia scopiformis]|uniref:RNase H type-1 domain-containing protein n=1 Tax=Mollisia scopiformis TaxID=149040 RepID=A0A194X6P6_MOLSC|nr:uncharacterized protein LY89DRAFT_670382 [Mollisia scopiformis]KUJ15843.1 hypothetical protein LY89DRAFT_670382 [Mollisia scopiformis]